MRERRQYSRSKDSSGAEQGGQMWSVDRRCSDAERGREEHTEPEAIRHETEEGEHGEQGHRQGCGKRGADGESENSHEARRAR